MSNGLPPHLSLPLPMVHHLQYRGSNRKPKEYEGDWPIRGIIYPCSVVLDESNGYRWVQIHGFVRPASAKGFRPAHFKAIAEVWLN